MSVTHRVTLSADEEMLEELKALRNLGTSREKMLEIFGGNMLPRLEQLEARKALSAKVIDAEIIDSPAETIPDEPDAEMLGDE